MPVEGLPGGAFACRPSSDSAGGILAQVLRTFDSLISSNCTQELENTGVDVWKHTQVGKHRASLWLVPSLLQRQGWGKAAVLGAACWAVVLATSLLLQHGCRHLLQGKSQSAPSPAAPVPLRSRRSPSLHVGCWM